jgi:hypothetical protein
MLLWCNLYVTVVQPGFLKKCKKDLFTIHLTVKLESPVYMLLWCNSMKIFGRKNISLSTTYKIFSTIFGIIQISFRKISVTGYL